jgi:hypothetical protein
VFLYLLSRHDPDASRSVHTLELVVDSPQDAVGSASFGASGDVRWAEGELLWGCVPSNLLVDLNDARFAV